MNNTILFACAGGLLINLVDLVELQTVPRASWPDFKNPLYWFPFMLWPCIGGLLAYAYLAGSNELSPILALNVGLSAPLTIKAMAEKVAPHFQTPIKLPPGA